MHVSLRRGDAVGLRQNVTRPRCLRRRPENCRLRPLLPPGVSAAVIDRAEFRAAVMRDRRCAQRRRLGHGAGNHAAAPSGNSAGTTPEQCSNDAEHSAEDSTEHSAGTRAGDGANKRAVKSAGPASPAALGAR
jgi:hypothetical protein